MHPRQAGDALGARIWGVNPAGGIGASRFLSDEEGAAINPRAASLSLLALG